ncbi:cell division protein FtsX, partial [Vibrio xuii]
MANKARNRKAAQARTSNRVKRDSFLKVHFKQAKESLVALMQRPVGNLLTLAVISMALAMP